MVCLVSRKENINNDVLIYSGKNKINWRIKREKLTFKDKTI